MHVSLALLWLAICWPRPPQLLANKMLDECLEREPEFTMNVVVLEDNTYAWSRPFVQRAVEEAIEEDRLENEKHGGWVWWCWWSRVGGVGGWGGEEAGAAGAAGGGNISSRSHPNAALITRGRANMLAQEGMRGQ